MSDSSQSQELEHTRFPCPSVSPGACSNSCPLCQWCHPTVSSSVASFSPCPHFFPASGSFSVSRLFTSDGQKHWSFTFSISPSNQYSGLIPLGFTGLILQSKGLSRVSSSTTTRKLQFFSAKPCSLVAQWQRIFLQYRNHRRYGFGPEVGKIPWRRAWQPTPASLPGESHRQRNLAAYSP